MTADPRPGRVPPEVREFFETREIRPAFSYLDVWREEHLSAFSVAKAVEGDVVEAFRAAVAEALNEGLPYREFTQRLAPILADKGWWGRQERTDPITGEAKEVQLGSPARLKLVLETNVRVARGAGQWQRIERRKRAQPLLRYRLGASERHRPDHAALDGLIFPVDHDFWDMWMPSNGYNCKCWVEQLTQARGEDLGYDGADPPEWAMELLDYTNPRTGRTVRAPRGIDPGFAFNPGKERLRGLQQVGILQRRR